MDQTRIMDVPFNNGKELWTRREIEQQVRDIVDDVSVPNDERVKAYPIWVIPEVIEKQLERERQEANGEVSPVETYTSTGTTCDTFVCSKCGKYSYSLTYHDGHGLVCLDCEKKLGLATRLGAQSQWMYVDTTDNQIARSLARIAFLLEKYIGATYPDLDLSGYTITTN